MRLGAEIGGGEGPPEGTTPPEILSPGLRRGLRLITLEGSLASIWISLTSGAILTAYALKLGATNLEIGLLSAFPFLTAFGQVSGSYIIERWGRRKDLCVMGALSSRILWLLVSVFSLVLWPGLPDTLLHTFLIIAFLSQALVAHHMVAWLSWMSLLIPVKIRGRYLGYRTQVSTLVTVVATQMGVSWLDIFSEGVNSHWGLVSFSTLFALGAILGSLGALSLSKVSGVSAPVELSGRLRTEGHQHPDESQGAKKGEWIGGTFVSLFRRPLEDTNFLKFALFNLFWSGAVYLSAPFFFVYMLKDLGMSYSYMGFLVNFATVLNLMTAGGWGALIDRFGNRPIMMVTGLAVSSIPLIMIFATKDNIYILGIIVQIISGVGWMGMNLAAGNLLLRLAPARNSSVYLAFFNTVSSIGPALSPLLGGVLADRLSGYLLIFVLSSVFRYVSLGLLRGVREPEQLGVRAVVRHLLSPEGVNTLLGLEGLLRIFAFPVRWRIISRKKGWKGNEPI